MNNLNHIFTLVCGNAPAKAQEVINRNRFYCEMIGVDFRIIPFTKPDNMDMGQAGDYHRFLYASENPCVIHLDWDCLLIDIPILNPKYPSFAFTNSIGDFDSYAFYSGENTDLFKQYLQFHDSKHKPGEACYWYTMMQFFSGKVQNFPASCYHHYLIGSWRK